MLGDESGYTLGDVQKTKLAAIEAEYETQPAPAGFTIIGIPNDRTLKTDYAVRVPALLGLIATRSLDGEVTGLKDLMKQHEVRIRSGMVAYDQLEKIRHGDNSAATAAAFKADKADLGYGLLLKRYTPNVTDATSEQIAAAVRDTIPSVAPLFFSFRIMVGLSMLMLGLIAASFYYTLRHTIADQRWLLRAMIFAMPAPWIACELGWLVAEYGRQPWAIAEVLPTFLATSSLTSSDVVFSLAGFVGFYTFLFVIEAYLMVKFARKGPASLGTGKYWGEDPTGAPGNHTVPALAE